MTVAQALWAATAAQQAGVLGRDQLLRLGLTEGQVGALLDNGRWQRVHPGVYATFTGPLPVAARAWAALLHGGRGACLGGPDSLWWWGLGGPATTVTTVCVPADRRVRPTRGVLVQHRRDLDRMRHPAATPPRLRIEEALLDVAEGLPPDQVVGLLLRATGAGRTVPARLRVALDVRPRHSRRRLVLDVLCQHEIGVRSPLEHRWKRDVERPHGLPRARRNDRETTVTPTGLRVSRYRDNRYDPWDVVVELDGRQAHAAEYAFRDRRRDNHLALTGGLTLRFGWQEVVGDACGCAAQVAQALQLRGWTGVPRRCATGCTAVLASS